MSKLTTVKIKYDNGNLSGQIPIGMEAENVYWNNQETLKDKLGDLDSDSRDVETRLEDAATRIQELEDADYETKISTAQNGIISLTNKLNNLPYITITSSNHIQKTDKTKIYKENGFLYYWGNGEWQKIRVSDAVGIKNITAGDNYSFNFELTDGRIFNTGSLRGAPGQDVGQKGVGIADVQHNEDNTLTFYFTGNIRVGQEGLETNQFTTGSIQGSKGVGIKNVKTIPGESNKIRFVYTEYVPDDFGQLNYEEDNQGQKYSYQDVPIYVTGGSGGSGGGTVERVVSISSIVPNENNTGFSIYLTNDSNNPAFSSGSLVGPQGRGIESINWVNNGTQLQITLDDGVQTTSESLIGPPGDKGRGISEASFDKVNNTLSLTFDKPLDNGSTTYTTPPIGGSGLASINYVVPQNYIDQVADFNGEDYTKVFQLMIADAKENNKYVFIPPKNYLLTKDIWTDDDIVKFDAGNYLPDPTQGENGRIKKLIISKALTHSPLFERVVTEFNPYFDPYNNWYTVTLENGQTQRVNRPVTDAASNGGMLDAFAGDTHLEGSTNAVVPRRMQGVCYIKEYDIFAIGFCQSTNKESKALLTFFRLTDENTFEYKGKGFVTYGGHLNSMCCRVEDTQTGRKATSSTPANRRKACIYATCSSEAKITELPGYEAPADPNNETQVNEARAAMRNKYGGERIQLARIPIDADTEHDVYSIPSSNTVLQVQKKNNSIILGDYGTTVNYNTISYFCGVTADGTTKGHSCNRSLMRMTYDDDNDFFYMEYGRTVDKDGNRTVQKDLEGNVILDSKNQPITYNYFSFKPFLLTANKWEDLCKKYDQHKFTFTSGSTTGQLYEGVADLEKARDEARKKLGIFSYKDFIERRKSGFWDFDGQAPTVFKGQLLHTCYVSNGIAHHGRFRNGTIIIHYNFNTGGVKKVYRIPSQWPNHQPQCAVVGKDDRIYLFNDLGISDSRANKYIRVTQLAFDDDVLAVPENPYTDPKRLNANYAKYHGVKKTENGEEKYYVNLNFITELGSYVFNGEQPHSSNHGSATSLAIEDQYNAVGIVNGPKDYRHYFTLYVLPLSDHFRLQVYISEHGEIHIRNGWVSNNTGGIAWYKWVQIATTPRIGASRGSSPLYTTGFLTDLQTSDNGKVRALHFQIPYATSAIAANRPNATISTVGALVLRQKGVRWYTQKDSNGNRVDFLSDTRCQKNNCIATPGPWGYHIQLQLEPGNYFQKYDDAIPATRVYMEQGPVGIYAGNFSLTFTE